MSNHEKKKASAPNSVNVNEGADGMTVTADASGNSYECRLDGVFQLRQNFKPIKLCDSLELVAHTRTSEGEDWGLWIRFRDADNRNHELILGRKLFTQGRKVEELLASKGLRLYVLSGNSGKCPLAEFFNAVPMDTLRRALSVSGGGYASAMRNSFVFANVTLSTDDAEPVILTDTKAAAVLNEQGTLEEWQEHVAAKALHSTRLMFGLCVGFSAPLLEMVEVPSSIFHFWGKRGSGKSSILKAAASIYGGKERVLSWNATGNGLEGLALQYNNQPLILDEIGQAKESAVNAVYDLCNETARARMDRSARLRNVSKWSVNVLSSGEFSLTEIKRQKARRGQEGIASGELVRFICIPSDAGQGLGVLDALPEGSDLVAGDRIKKAADFVKSFSSLEYTGSAGRAYLMALMRDFANSGREEFRKRLTDAMETMEKRLANDGWEELKDSERRVLERFAVVALAGELATGYGIMGDKWKISDAASAALECFNAWRQSEDSPEEREANVVAKLLEVPHVERTNFLVYEKDEKNGSVRFIQEAKQKACGMVVLTNPNDMASQVATLYLVSQFNDVCERYGEGLSRREIIEALDKHGVLFSKHKDAKHWKQHQLRKDFLGLKRGKWLYVTMPDDTQESRERVEKLFREG